MFGSSGMTELHRGFFCFSSIFFFFFSLSCVHTILFYFFFSRRYLFPRSASLPPTRTHTLHSLSFSLFQSSKDLFNAHRLAKANDAAFNLLVDSDWPSSLRHAERKKKRECDRSQKRDRIYLITYGHVRDSAGCSGQERRNPSTAHNRSTSLCVSPECSQADEPTVRWLAVIRELRPAPKGISFISHSSDAVQ